MSDGEAMYARVRYWTRAATNRETVFTGFPLDMMSTQAAMGIWASVVDGGPGKTSEVRGYA